MVDDRDAAIKLAASQGDEFKITPAMMEAGVDALMRAPLNDEEVSQYPQIVKSVFEAMEAVRD